MPGDTIHLVLPTDPRYLDIAVATAQTLADRAGIDSDGVASFRAQLHDALGERIGRCHGPTVTIRFDVGDGYLGVRLEGDTSYAHT